MVYDVIGTGCVRGRIFVYMRGRMFVYLNARAHRQTGSHMYVCMYVCMHVCMYMYMSMHLHTHTHTHTHTQVPFADMTQTEQQAAIDEQVRASFSRPLSLPLRTNAQTCKTYACLGHRHITND